MILKPYVNKDVEANRLNEEVLDESTMNDFKAWLGDYADVYLPKFKQYITNNKISGEKKNIDYWLPTKKRPEGRPVEELIQIIDDLDKAAEAKKASKEKKKADAVEGADLIAANDNWYVYHIKNAKAAQHYGQGTMWCLAGRYNSDDDNKVDAGQAETHFKHYDGEANHRIYMAISSNPGASHPVWGRGGARKYVMGQKICVCFNHDGAHSWNADDTETLNWSLVPYPLPIFKDIPGIGDVDMNPKINANEVDNEDGNSFAGLKVNLDPNGVITGYNSYGSSKFGKYDIIDHYATAPLNYHNLFDCPWAYKEIVGDSSKNPGDKYTGIGDGAFKGASLMTMDLDLNHMAPNIKRIGKGAFQGSNLQLIIIPDNTTELGQSAFMNCNALKTVKLGTGITDIPRKCFAGCRNLVEVEVNGNIQHIDPEAFRYCTSLRSIYCADPEGAENQALIEFCNKNHLNYETPGRKKNSRYVNNSSDTRDQDRDAFLNDTIYGRNQGYAEGLQEEKKEGSVKLTEIDREALASELYDIEKFLNEEGAGLEYFKGMPFVGYNDGSNSFEDQYPEFGKLFRHFCDKYLDDNTDDNSLEISWEDVSDSDMNTLIKAATLLTTKKGDGYMHKNIQWEKLYPNYAE